MSIKAVSKDSILRSTCCNSSKSGCDTAAPLINLMVQLSFLTNKRIQTCCFDPKAYVTHSSCSSRKCLNNSYSSGKPSSRIYAQSSNTSHLPSYAQCIEEALALSQARPIEPCTPDEDRKYTSATPDPCRGAKAMAGATAAEISPLASDHNLTTEGVISSNWGKVYGRTRSHVYAKASNLSEVL